MTLQDLNYPNSDLGVLICGHGSRDEIAVEEFKNLASSLKSKLPNIPFDYGFLEFAKPSITDALNQFKKKSIKKIIAIPAMLFAAGHVKNDIPSLLNQFGKKNGIEIIYGKELGINNLMIGAASERVRQVISSREDLILSDVLLVVVGRGSSDPDANSNVFKITRMIVECLGLGWGETVFSGVTFPLVEPGLRHAVNLGFKKIIVFPYFLFSGVLVSRIRSQTKLVSIDFPEIEFIDAEYLSDHPLVIETFLERIAQVSDGDNLMNCALCKYRSELIGFESEVGLSQENHHHEQAELEIKSFCDEISDESFKKDNQELNIDINLGHQHSHSNKYPQANHPLGPVTLRSLDEC